MAANFQSRGLASLGKRLVGQVKSRDTVSLSPLSSRRGIHDSIYNKNVEENANPIVVPDDVIPPQAAAYWAPHPRTGVFGPASEGKKGGDANADENDDSVMHQTAFFRPLEDLDKPPVELHKQGDTNHSPFAKK